MKSKTSSGNLRNKLLTILFFLFVASIFGIFNKFSKEYTYEVPFQIKYNIPPNRFLVSNPPRNVSVEIRGTGWLLFFENLDNSKRIINYNCSDKINQIISQQALQDSVNHFIDPYNLRTLNINPKEIEINLSPAASKEIRIIQPVKASYFPSYGLVKPMILSDSTITIFGSKEALELIDEMVLDTLRFDDLKKDTKKTIYLPEFTDQHISFEKKFIDLTILVDQFTQKSFKLPFDLKNFPNKRNFEFIPKEILITVDIPLQKYNTITKENFKLQLNYSELQKTSEKKLIPVTVSKSSVPIDRLNIRPQFVEVIEIQR